MCTGSLLLGAAGVLDGLEATTHWLDMDDLERYGARPTGRRVVEQGKVITAAGVSSGIDMGLVLAAKIAGPEVAQAIQLGIEYDPQPPFDSGSVEKAAPETVELIREPGGRADLERDGPEDRVGRFPLRNGNEKRPTPRAVAGQASGCGRGPLHRAVRDAVHAGPGQSDAIAP